MAKKKAAAAEVAEVPAAPQINVELSLMAEAGSRRLYLSKIDSDVAISWGNTNVVVLIDANTGDVVSVVLAIRQPGQDDVRVVDAKSVGTHSTSLYAVSRIDFNATIKVDPATLLSAMEITHFEQLRRPMMAMHQMLLGMVTGDHGGPADMPGVVEAVERAPFIGSTEDMPDGSPVDTDGDENEDPPFDVSSSPLIDYIEKKDAVEETPSKPKRGRKSKAAKEEAAAEVPALKVADTEEDTEVADEIEVEVEVEEDIPEELEDDDDAISFDPTTEFYLAETGEIVAQSEFEEDEAEDGQGNKFAAFFRKGDDDDVAYRLMPAPDDEDVPEWLVRADGLEDFADDSEDSDEEEGESGDADDADDDDDDDLGEEIVPDEEEVSYETQMTPAQEKEYNRLTSKLHTYELASLTTVANRWEASDDPGVIAAAKAKSKSKMLDALHAIAMDLALQVKD